MKIFNKDDKDEKDKKSEPPFEKLLKARKVLITGGVDDEMAQRVCSTLLIMAAENEDPIDVFISSPGGHVESGDMIYDMIKFIKPTVRVIGSGWVASAGALIFVGAEKKNRFCLPNTRFLLHQPSGGARGQASDIAIEAEQIVKMRERLNKIFADETGQSLKKIQEDTERDFWMSAKEAIEYGLVHKIIKSESELPKK